MGKEINLDGAETSIIKALGFGGGEITGDVLMDRVSNLDAGELIDALCGLIAVGFVSSSQSEFKNAAELKCASFQVNSGYTRDLKACLDPDDDDGKSRRIRRE